LCYVTIGHMLGCGNPFFWSGRCEIINYNYVSKKYKQKLVIYIQLGLYVIKVKEQGGVLYTYRYTVLVDI